MNIDEDFGSLKDEEVLFASLEKPALFRVLMARYEKAFLRKAKSVVYREEDAEDVVQDVFVTFVQSIEKFRLTGSLKGYLAKKQLHLNLSWACFFMIWASPLLLRLLKKTELKESPFQTTTMKVKDWQREYQRD